MIRSYRVSSIWPRTEWRRLPELDVRRVIALGQVDADGVVLAVGFIIFAQLVAQPRRLDAHDGIDGWIERLGTIENFNSDVVALQPLAAPGQGLIDDVFQEPLAAPGLVEWAALEDAVQLLPDGRLVGFAPAIERNCRHVNTELGLATWTSPTSGRLIRLHTRTNRQGLPPS